MKDRINLLVWDLLVQMITPTVVVMNMQDYRILLKEGIEDTSQIFNLKIQIKLRSHLYVE